MTRVALFGCQRIALDFLDVLESMEDLKVVLVVSSERERDKLLGCESLMAKARSHDRRAVASERGSDTLGLLTEAKPDILFSVYYRARLSPEALRIPRLGCVNIHPSLLPRYRGLTPTAWALLNGEDTFGITIHDMDSGIDTGAVLAQEEYAIGPDETGYELHVRAMRLGLDMLTRNVRALVDRTLEPREQVGCPSYYGALSPDHTIDWQRPAKRVRDAIRVYATPYAGAMTALQNVCVRVDRARVLDRSDAYRLQGPGRVVDLLADDAVVVSAADGFVVLDRYETSPGLTHEEFVALFAKGVRLG